MSACGAEEIARTFDLVAISERDSRPQVGSDRRVGPRALQWIVLAAPLVILAVAGYTHRWIYDDGWIYLRVVRQIRVGHGPVFNTGQRVEAFTSPMWTAILVAADFVFPISLEWLAVLLGIASTVAGAAYAMRGAALLCRRAAGDAFLIPVGVLVFAALPPVWYFETAGLETGLTFLWFGLCFWLLATWSGRPDARLSLPASIVLGLGWLIRPELVVASAVFVVTVSALQWHASTWKQRCALVVAALALPLAYEVFRMGYYGLLVSSTAIAKEGARLRVGTGWQYVLDFVAPYRLWLPLALLMFAIYVPFAVQLQRRGESRSVWVLAAFGVAAIGCAAGVVGFGGDYIHGRLLLPALFALCTPVAVVPVTRRYASALAILGWSAVCAFTLRAPENAKHIYHFRGGIPYSLPVRGCCGHISLSSVGWAPASPLRSRFDLGAVYVSDTKKNYGTVYTPLTTPTSPNIRLPTIATGGIGILSYALGPRFSILDLNGLADTTAAHLALTHRGYPGHEKTLPAPWVAALVTRDDTRPLEAEFPIAPESTTPPDLRMPFDEQVRYARQALQCGALRDLRRSVEQPLTFGRFVSNVVHSHAFTTLRIPSNPRDAFARFCRQSSSAIAGPASGRLGRIVARAPTAPRATPPDTTAALALNALAARTADDWNRLCCCGRPSMHAHQNRTVCNGTARSPPAVGR